MTKAISCFVLLMIVSICGLYSVNYSITFSNSDYQIVADRGFQAINFTGTQNTSIIGAPQLPVKYLNFIIPTGMDVSNILEEKQTELLPNQYNIIPVQPPIPTLIGYVPGPFVNPDPQYYSINELYPKKSVEIVNQGYFDGSARIVTIAIYPFQYRPLDQKLILNKEFRISFDYINSQQTPIFVGQRSAYTQVMYDDMLAKIVVNPEDIQSNYIRPNVSSSKREPIDYVIISTNEIIPLLTDLINWKRGKGLIVKTVSVDEIVQDAQYASGDEISGIIDAAGSIRQYLFEQYRNGCAYALFIGDETNFPVRFGIAVDNVQVGNITMGDYYTPTDLYFGEFNGNWNTDNDLRYGESNEDSPDFYQEMFVGRILIPSTQAFPNYTQRISNWINKLISYELNPGYGDTSYLDKALYFRADEGAGVNSISTQVDIFTESNFHVTDICEPNPGGPLGYPSGDQAIDIMSEGFGFSSFYCHGYTNQVAVATQGYNSGDMNQVLSLDYENDNVDGNGFDDLAADGKYSINSSIACHNGNYINDNLIASPSMPFEFTSNLSRGGPAMICNTHFGYWSQSNVLQDKFIEYLFEPSDVFPNPIELPLNTIGIADAASRAMYHPNNYVARHCIYARNLFGDPEMPIWTATPKKMEVIYERQSNSLIVTSDGVGVPDAFVHFFNDDFSESRIFYTDGHGMVECAPQYTNAYIGKTNYLPLLKHFITHDEVWDDVRYVKYDVIVTEGSTLTINDDVHLSSFPKYNNAKIIVEEGGTLQINTGNIYGEAVTGKPIELDGVFAIGNSIEVYGVVNIGESVRFTSEGTNMWDGLFIHGVNQMEGLSLAHLNFANCNLELSLRDYTISNSSFSNSMIICNDGKLTVENCPLIGGIKCHHCEEVRIINTTGQTCVISGPGDGVSISDCGMYEIIGYDIVDNDRFGIYVSETLGIASQCLIKDCHITGNAEDGIRFYHTNSLIEGCTISGNSIGVAVYRGSNVQIEKEIDSEPGIHDSVISNNTFMEILFQDDCDLQLNRRRNKIIDDSIDNDFDQYLIQCPNMSRTRYCRVNAWHLENGLSVFPERDRFYPEVVNPGEGQIGYDISPIWEFTPIEQVNYDTDETAYYTAIDFALANNPSEACRLFKEIIGNCPNSEYAPSSAKNLIALEQDKLALKNYYHTEENLHWNSEICKLADYLENYCNIKLGDYQAAITWFESVISNPPSELDSLMSIIDLGYVYLLMQDNGSKAQINSAYPYLKPKSRIEYEQNKDAILSYLNFPKINSENGSGNSVIPKITILDKNYPNPFNPTTTISFSIPKDMKCNLEIFNIKGQKVKTLINGIQVKGQHKIVWDGTDTIGKSVSSGVYFYKLTTPDKVLTNKMIMLK